MLVFTKVMNIFSMFHKKTFMSAFAISRSIDIITFITTITFMVINIIINQNLSIYPKQIK